jgi:hypothetical protein
MHSSLSLRVRPRRHSIGLQLFAHTHARQLQVRPIEHLNAQKCFHLCLRRVFRQIAPRSLTCNNESKLNNDSHSDVSAQMRSMSSLCDINYDHSTHKHMQS